MAQLNSLQQIGFKVTPHFALAQRETHYTSIHFSQSEGS